MSLTAGTRLGPYEILSLLGSGGMGEVYRAQDTKLGRDVALKILPATFTHDPERLARFRREAQVLAALNHPHIGAIYGLDDANGTQFLVLELVDGESLDKRIARGKIPVDEGLGIAKQIVAALEAAHEKGIIHRDLKPANIALTHDGNVKVLDFGLAKATEPASGTSLDVTNSPTITSPAMMTGVGVILGTAAYMSPEQARGRPADRRSDVWAFGCVLYEMLAGKRAFDGDEVADIIAAIVRGEPDWDELPPSVGPAVREVLKRCLLKDRQARIPEMSVVRFFMADAERQPSAAIGASRNGSRRRTARLVAVGGLVAGISSVATWLLVRAPIVPAGTARFAVLTSPAQAVGIGGPDRAVVVAGDGRHIVSLNGGALGEGGQLLVRAIDQLEAVPLRGLENVRAPFVSADGRWIGFFATGELKKVPMAGGPPITICRVTGGIRGSTWGPDGTIIFATNDPNTGLFSVPASGGEPKLLTKPDSGQGELDHFFPEILPDGRSVLFNVTKAGGLDSAEIAVLDLKTGRRKTVILGGTSPAYVHLPTRSAQAGYILYASSGALRAVAFDLARLEPTSDPTVVVDQVQVEATGAAQFSVSRDGTLVYTSGAGAGFEARSLVWVDRHGREQPITVAPRAYLHPRISPDGSRIAVAIADQGQDIWILDPVRPALTRLTFGSAVEQYPIWTPDGRRVVFRSDRSGLPHVFWQAADNTGTIEQLTFATQSLVIPHALTPDGNTLIVGIGSHIGIERLDNRQKITTIAEAQGSQGNAAISPDGHWLAYNSTESGPPQIYVRPFPNVDAGRWQISTSGGFKPIWARNGQEVFYFGLAPESALMAVPVRTNGTFTFGNPSKLFDGRPYFTAPRDRTYDVSPDGQKFLLIKAVQTAEANSMPPQSVLILNWFTELQQRVPTR